MAGLSRVLGAVEWMTCLDEAVTRDANPVRDLKMAYLAVGWADVIVLDHRSAHVLVPQYHGCDENFLAIVTFTIALLLQD